MKGNSLLEVLSCPLWELHNVWTCEGLDHWNSVLLLALLYFHLIGGCSSGSLQEHYSIKERTSNNVGRNQQILSIIWRPVGLPGSERVLVGERLKRGPSDWAPQHWCPTSVSHKRWLKRSHFTAWLWGCGEVWMILPRLMRKEYGELETAQKKYYVEEQQKV